MAGASDSYDSSAEPVRFTGHQNLPMRLLLSTLTGRPIQITKIRSESRTSPGLLHHEVSLIRLLTALTNGTTVELSVTGTALLYRPGLITGTPAGYGADVNGVLKFEIEAPPRIQGQSFERRGISYWLAPICLLAPFAKNPVSVVLSGPGVITGSTSLDVSADTVRTGILPLFSKFGIQGDVEIRVLKRACRGGEGGGGGGEVQVVFGKVAQVRLPKTVHFMTPGRVKKIRGVAYAVGVGSGNNPRMIDKARELLNQVCPDTYIYSDVASAPHMSAARGGKRTGLGFGLVLVAETATGALYSADLSSPPDGGEVPEDIGRNCALQLLEVISEGGCLSRTTALPFFVLMALGSEDVGRVTVSQEVIGREEIISLARDMKAIGLNPWGFRASSEQENGLVVSIVGKGVGNVARKVV